MSVGNFLLLLFSAIGGKVVKAGRSLVALVKSASKSLKALAKLAKPFTALMKKGVQKLLRNKKVRTMLRGAKRIFKPIFDPIKRLVEPYIKKISERLRDIKPMDAWRRIVNVSELINLDPKAWANAAAIGKRFGSMKKIGDKLGKFISNKLGGNDIT